ncbi:uncharacterized protein PITG_11130 [Phytophthora infestans T30-4]|uniref:Uncharacterized protein n=1 Tax=Phytophthora infestans (strain T30-4) TaxID=403677 RepID=D0NG92_PHYIT|nr:uncharacterized protein PITG_11130 [Phytophthora infestans T30-4]EEY57293.1 conserved hypothetical protein [Phytophthora infestans T30-4]|eukprot:XP_002901903.1 conserved hypothetical protein [Phytophthora infestans T30-4]
MEATGALEELLLEQRALIDHALYSVLEDAPLGDLLEHFQSTLLGLQQQEPSFWHLQVVDFIRSVFKSRVGSCIDAEVKAAASKKPQNPDIAVNRAKAQVQTSSELQEALVQLQRDVEMEVARIKDVLTEKHLKVASDMDEHFLVKFWTELQDVIGTKANQHKLDEEREVKGVEQELESCSFERFSFDEDFNDLSRSAMRVVYDLMNQVEDAAQFLELFWAVLDFMGARLETGELFLYRREICDAQSIAAVDCFRVLHALLFKTMRHWVYLAAEALAQVLHSTFRLLITYSKAETEVEAKQLTPLTMLFLVDNDPVRWFKLWLLNAPSSRQLFVAMDESGFIADLLQNLSRFRPLSFEKSSNRSVNAIEKRIAQCELRDELGADYPDLGKGVVDALILSVAAVIVTTSCSQKDTDVLFNEQWSTSISRSVATYLHCADAPDLLPALTKAFEVAERTGVIDELWKVSKQCEGQECSRLGSRITIALLRSVSGWLRCCLSSQFAASSLLSSEDNALVQFISEALTVHRAGFCMSSSHAEDTCCVAFQLLIALVSSVPSMLECSSLLSKLKVLNLDDKCTLQRGILNDISEILGPCSFLEKQLCYEFEFIGGPSEKLPQCELFEFDGRCQETQIDSKDTTGERADRTISEFAGVLQNKILQAISDGVEAGSSTPMDFVLISQASWELIHDLEARFGAESPFICCNPAGPANELFARLTFNLVMSQRSRLEPARSVAVALIQTTSPTPNSESFFPTDSERKLMNRLYKNYASGLSLESSPTLLHCTVKKFGKIAMDCFPVTMLIGCHPTFDEADILNFLSHCLASPSAGYLWPRSADRGVAVVITKGVEIILAREFPQLLGV